MSRNGKRTVKKIVSLTFLLLYKLCTAVMHGYKLYTAVMHGPMRNLRSGHIFHGGEP